MSGYEKWIVALLYNSLVNLTSPGKVLHLVTDTDLCLRVFFKVLVQQEKALVLSGWFIRSFIVQVSLKGLD